MKDLPASIFQSSEWPTTDLSEENATSNALMISLFTDQRVVPLPKNETIYRGHWADSIDPKKFELGSKLWTLSNQPLHDETLENSIELAYEALSPLIPQVINDLSVDGRILKGKLELQIEVTIKGRKLSYQLDLLRGRYAFI